MTTNTEQPQAWSDERIAQEVDRRVWRSRHASGSEAQAIMMEIRDDLCATIATLQAERDEARREVERLRRGVIRELAEVEQSLGRALHYPRYCDDPENFPAATEADGVCVGEHTAATIALSAESRIGELEAENGRLKAQIQQSEDDYKDELLEHDPYKYDAIYGDNSDDD